MILNVVLVRASVASHESDQVQVPPNHVMEDTDWVHEGSRWKCKINGCTDAYATKWLFHQHLDNKHRLHMDVGKFGHPSTCRNPNLAKCGGEAQHLEKLGIWSPPGLPNV